MSERYPDEYWLADFERRLSDGRLLTREESLGLIAELRRIRLERSELRAALEPLQIKLSGPAHMTCPDPGKKYSPGVDEHSTMTISVTRTRQNEELCPHTRFLKTLNS